MEFTLLGSVAVAAAAFGLVLWLDTRDAPDERRAAWDRASVAAIAGLFAGRLAAMIGGGTNPITHPGDILIVRGGVDTGIAALTSLMVFAWTARTDLWQAADALAPAAVAGLGGWHASCLLRGACLGTPSDLPWARALEGSDITRHPVEVYAALAFLAAAAGLALWKRRRPPAGVVGGAALAVAGAVRLVTEPLRPGLGSGPEAWYTAAIVAGLAVVVLRTLAARRTVPGA
jgi:prolipoprotein diacylglyceryltransferase